MKKSKKYLEDTLPYTGSKFLNDRLTEIINMHNRYCISKIQKQTVNKLQTFFDDDNCKLLDDKSEIFNIIKNVDSKLSVFKNCNSVKTDEMYNILNKNFYEIQGLFDNAARIFLETKSEEMVDKFAYFREASPEEFVDMFKETKDAIPALRSWRYDTTLSPEDYKKRNAKCFVTPFKSVVAIADNDEILSLCISIKDSGLLSMNKIFDFVKEHSGKFMYCFEELSKIYTKYGFEEVSRKSWDRAIENKAIKNGWGPSFSTEDEVKIRLKVNDDPSFEHARSLEEEIEFYTSEEENKNVDKPKKHKDMEMEK